MTIRLATSPPGMTSHAVGDSPQSATIVDEECILIA